MHVEFLASHYSRILILILTLTFVSGFGSFGVSGIPAFEHDDGITMI